MAQDFHLSADHVLVRIQRAAAAVGVAALLLCGIGTIVDPTQFFRSYLVAYLFWIGIALGCMGILMIQHITGGAWGAMIRRPLESGARTLPLLAILFLPILLGLEALYEWARPEHVAHDPVLQHKSLYLNAPFFAVRAALYFAAWIAVSTFLRRWSLEQDETVGDGPALRLEMLSRGGLLLYGLTMTFAAVDWAMSLEPHWFSTIYGILFAGGQVLSAFAFVIPVAALLAAEPSLAEVMTAGRFHDLGKLLLAFIMLWAYFALSQFLIIWSGNLPEENVWYLARLRGGWQWVGAALIAFHFVLPFVVLLSRDVKRGARRLAVVATVLLGFRYLDLFWLIAPAFSPGALSLHWLDPAALFGLGGIWLWVYIRQLRGHPLVPLRDPALLEAA
jgi:hypothetical protein